MAVVMEMTIANVPTTELDKDSQPTSLQGFLTNNEWDQLLSKTDHLVSELEKIKEEKTRKKVFELLDSMNEVVIEGYLDSPRQEYDRVRKFISDSFKNDLVSPYVSTR